MNQLATKPAASASPEICATRGKVCLTESEAIASSHRHGVRGTKPGKLLAFSCVFCGHRHTGHLQKPRRRGKGHE